MCGNVKHIDDFKYKTGNLSGYCIPCRMDYKNGARNERDVFNIKERVKHVADTLVYMGFSVGDKLIAERQLSEMTGFSRNTLRESLVVMEYLGYVTGGHGKVRKVEKCLTGLIS